MSLPDGAGHELDAIFRWLSARTGLEFAPNRLAQACSAIRRAMTEAGTDDPAHYLELLQTSTSKVDALMAEVTVGETYFFREPQQLSFIRKVVLPDIAKRRGPGRAPRVLSAGCSSGEEAYSLAVLLERAGMLHGAHVLGVDISRTALARAREGLYGTWSLRGVDEQTLRHEFREEDGRFRLDERIRQRVSFEYLNLAAEGYPSLPSGIWSMDLIVCRNVLIYLDAQTVRRVLRHLYDALADGGWLVLGSSDPAASDSAPFEPVVTPNGVFYRRGDSTAPVFGWCARPTPDVTPLVASATQAEVARAAPPEPVPQTAPVSDEQAGTALEHAREALRRGDYTSALDSLRGDESAVAWDLRVRAHANRDGAPAALQVAAEGVRRHPLNADMHFLQTMLLLDLGELDEAISSLRRVLYLDRTLAVAHLTLGTLLRRRGDLAGARRAYRNAAQLARERPEDELVRLGEGELAGQLARAAETEASLLEPSHGPGARG